jgi:hypothetical protein
MWDLPTPALILDLDAMTRNLDRLAAHYPGPEDAGPSARQDPLRVR